MKMNLREINKEDFELIFTSGFEGNKFPQFFFENLKSESWKENAEGLIHWLLDQNVGIIAQNEAGSLLGYLLFIAPLDGFFGICDGAFSPFGGNWVNAGLPGAERTDVMSRMLQKGMEILVKKEITSVAVSQSSCDTEIMSALVLNGFGIRCSDAMLEIKNDKLFLLRKPDEKIIYEILPETETDTIKPLFEKLEDHLEESPCFFSKDKDVFKMWKQKHGASVIVAKDNEKIAGYIAYNGEGENFMVCNHSCMNICGMYVLPEYRALGVADGLTAAVYEMSKNHGYKYLGVDYETINPTALHYWTKYFAPYTYSFHRRIDERVCK